MAKEKLENIRAEIRRDTREYYILKLLGRGFLGSSEADDFLNRLYGTGKIAKYEKIKETKDKEKEKFS